MEKAPRRRAVGLGFVLLLVLAVTGEPILFAQDGTNAPPPRVRVVGVIAGGELNSLSPESPGDEGLALFSEIISSYGATVSVLEPDRAIPPEIELVVIIRPQRPFSTAQTAHLWRFLQDGGHLLLAIDPIGHAGSAAESIKTSGLNRLLQAEYGLSLVDNLLVEDWFGLESLGELSSSWSEIQPAGLMSHVINRSQIQYEVPVRFWGARSVLVDALTGNADAAPLMFTESAYGETAAINFQSGSAAQLTLNIGPDTQGRAFLGAVATNTRTGSRVAIIGDSEIFQDGFGQRRHAEREGLPLYVGSYMFAQRLTAWLLGVAPAAYPSLPAGFTWITLDGAAWDWPENAAIVGGQVSTGSPYSLRQIRAFQNDQYVYLMLEPRNWLPLGTFVYIFVADSAGNHQMISVDSQGHFRYQGQIVADAAVGIYEAIEIRVPRRLFPTDVSEMARVCLGDASGSQIECTEGAVLPANVDAVDPLPVRTGAGPQAFTRLDNTNLRAGPTTQSRSITTLPSDTLFAVMGRNAAGDWVLVQNGRYAGWISLSLLALNADVGRLPNLEATTSDAAAAP